MRPISVQLYTLRDAMQADMPGTLQRLADMGFTHVEPYRFVDDVDGVAAALSASGLVAPSAHTRFVGEDQRRIFSAAARLGVETLVQPSSDKGIWGSIDDVRTLADQLNEAAVVGADHGIRVGYHNHAFEYEAGIDAPLERFAEMLHDGVTLQIDTYWAAVAGDDPVSLLRKLGDRAGLLHVKDGPVTAETLDQLPVGAGRMPVAEILDAAPHALAIVELDAYAGDVFEAVQQSLGYLRTHLSDTRAVDETGEAK